ncbi:tail fiber assembly protein [Pantoea sp. 3_1284]|uniref:tail fiber assembly protein n=1 Tax=Pantoea sp. 3_1284 TaxID=2259618 RepID=UPI000DE42318|nr:tail fiber assembly protein [Pantoea sp. 3_1284]RBO14360.1 tail assembly chaperone [Pantoea sp. 3_1284]
MTFLYSPSTDGMYPLNMKDDYVSAGSWPQDGVEISQEIYEEFNANPPEGKRRALVGEKMKWVDIPPKPAKQINEESLATKNMLLFEAGQRISIWQTKLLMGRKLSDEEEAKLNSWLDYIDVLSGINIDSGKEIDWPAKPE